MYLSIIIIQTHVTKNLWLMETATGITIMPIVNLTEVTVNVTVLVTIIVKLSITKKHVIGMVVTVVAKQMPGYKIMMTQITQWILTHTGMVTLA
jgi:hypothetical protein